MKKILLLLSILLITGCFYKDNTPKRVVEEYFSRYNKLDEEVLRDLDTKIYTSGVMPELRTKTKKIYLRQYRDLECKVKKVDKDKFAAAVKVIITIYDYEKAEKEALNYIDKHPEKFMTDNDLDEEKIGLYLINEKNKTKKRISKTLNIKLHKDNNKWKVDKLKNVDIKKINE